MTTTRDAANPYHDKGGKFTFAPGGPRSAPTVTEEAPPRVERAAPSVKAPAPSRVATTADATAAVESWSDRWSPFASDAEKDAIAEYAGPESEDGKVWEVDLANNIRTGGQLHSYDAEIAENIDNAFSRPGAVTMDRITIQRDITAGTASRQMQSLARQNNLVGARVTDRAYVSGTMDPYWGGAGGDVRLRLSVPEGNPAIPLTEGLTGHDGGAEVLLPRDTVYTVVGFDMTPEGRLTVDAEVQAR